MWIRRSVFLSLFLLAIFVFPPRSFGNQAIIVNISVNQEAKGDFFVELTDEGDFFVPIGDLKKMGFREPTGRTVDDNGVVLISLASIRGVGFRLDERTLSLEITAIPALLGERVIDLGPRRPDEIVYTNDSSAFLNYRVAFLEQNSFEGERFELTNQLGIYHQGFLFLTDSVYTQTAGEGDWVRLMSNVTFDRLHDRQRLVVGDFFAFSGQLGSTANLGGVSLTKVYSLDPYFLKNPQIDFTGSVFFPTDVEIRINGQPIRRDRLSPGEFTLRNIPSTAGVGLLEIILRDPFGREERLESPFYVDETLLREGLHEYSYGFGFLREEFGFESFEYGSRVASAFHRYGFRDWLTAGLSGEASRSRLNLGPTVAAEIKTAGVVALSAAGSRNENGDSGGAVSWQYRYLSRRLNAQLVYQFFSQNYVTAVEAATPERPKSEGLIGLGYGSLRVGFAAVEYREARSYPDRLIRIFRTSYSRLLTSRASFLVTYETASEAGENDYSIMLNFQYHLGGRRSFSARAQRTEETTTASATLQQNAPVGPGTGGRLHLETTEADGDRVNTLDSLGQLNLAYGIYTAEYRQVDSDHSAQVTAAGAFSLVGRTVRVSRPINDSFALVRVGDLEGVRVRHNNQEIGRTDATGRILVPNLSSHIDNQIEINDRDVPLDRTLSAVRQVISPPLRSGSLVTFKTDRFRAVFGKLLFRQGITLTPIEFLEIEAPGSDGKIVFPTGEGGEFYVENAAPGRYEATIALEAGACVAFFEIPDSPDPLIDIGEVSCAASD